MLNDLYHHLNPVAFSVGPFAVRWYGLAYLAGFVLTALIMWRVSRRWKVDVSGDELYSVVISCCIGVIVGARLAYVLFYGAGYYLSHPLEIFALNEGGMSFHGGVAGALVAGLICCRTYGLCFRTLADMAVIGAPCGLFFGRLANFVNGELWGKPTDLPWGVVFETGGNVARHPSQLYEALLEGVVLLVVMVALSRKLPPRPQGTFLGTFLLLYGIFRFLIEFVRLPDAQIGYLFGTGWLTMGQVLSTPLIAIGIVELVLARRRGWAQRGHVGPEPEQDASLG